MELGVSVLLRPKIERNRGQFVDQRVGEAVLAEIDGLDVGAAGIAALDPDVGERFGSIDGQFGVVFLAASGADDTAEFPLAQAEAADQVSAGAVALWAKHARDWLAAAEWAQGMGVALELKRNVCTNEFRVGLKKGEGEELAGFGRDLSGAGPEVIQQVGPGIG